MSPEQNQLRLQLQEDFRDVFGTKAGERVLRHLMTQFCVFTSTHMTGDSHESDWREGERHVVLYIIDNARP